MEISSIIQTIFGTLWYLIPLAILTVILKSSWFKGVTGEFLVNTCAQLFLPENEYYLIKDVTLPTKDGTTQIDHIVVSRYGIFVIETKNMKGWIFGSTNQKTWTQKIYKHTSQFQNPLHQNYKHIKVLEALLNIPPTAIHSLVVFIGDATLKTDMPDNVTYGGRYIHYIKSRREVLLDRADIDSVIAKIEGVRLQRGLATNRQHVSHLKEKRAQRSLSTPQCPKCGGDMVLRTTKRGKNAGDQFWGCSSFPACTAIGKSQ